MQYLLNKKIRKIDYVIISHFDSDHIGGLFNVIDKLKVETIIIPKQSEQSENYQRFAEITQNKKINMIVVGASNARPQKIQIQKDLYIDILWPDNSNSITENSINNNSIVCKLTYGEFSILFTGDIEEIAEREILQKYKDNLSLLKSTILKVAHHGSKTSSTQEFIKAVNPKIALIGVGENNKFGHPNEDVTKRLEDLRNKNISYRPNGRDNNNSR